MPGRPDKIEMLILVAVSILTRTLPALLQGWLELTVLPGLLAASHLLELHRTEKPAALNAQLP